MNPSSNLYLTAIRLIKPSQCLYLQYKERTINQAKQWVAVFHPAKVIWASIQAVQRDSYTKLGLDFQKNYIKLWADKNIIDLGRDVSGDRFIMNGLIFQIESQTAWFSIDGWSSCIAVEVGAAPAQIDGIETKPPYNPIAP